MADQRFTDNGETVTDRMTGLMWEKKRADGAVDWRQSLHSVNAACSWPEATGAWLDAVNSETFAGSSDWRIPMPYELVSIVAYDQAHPPALDPVFGPVASAFYWTAAPVAFHTALAWRIFFLDGSVFVDDKGNRNRVRAVRPAG